MWTNAKLKKEVKYHSIRRGRFAKYRSSNLQTSALIAERNVIVVILDISISTGLKVSFSFEEHSIKASLK